MAGPVVYRSWMSDSTRWDALQLREGDVITGLDWVYEANKHGMGIRIVNRANNHTGDNGDEGMFETNALLDQVGIVHAGTGRNLEEARDAAYLTTSKGRVGLVGLMPMSALGHAAVLPFGGAGVCQVGLHGGPHPVSAPADDLGRKQEPQRAALDGSGF